MMKDGQTVIIGAAMITAMRDLPEIALVLCEIKQV